LSLDLLRERLLQRLSDLRARDVTVLAGGSSSEREVSLRSGEAVAAALSVLGYTTTLLNVATDGASIAPAAHQHLTQAAGAVELAEQNGSHSLTLSTLLPSPLRSAGIIFTTMHGASGENGAWQGLLELLNIPYVSAGVKGSALAMDKLVSKRLFSQMGIPTPQWWLHSAGNDARRRVPAEVQQLVAKPVAEGSSVGVLFADNDNAGWDAINTHLGRFDPLLIEERISGTELTAAVIGQSDQAVALPLVEIRPSQEFYSYEAKYTSGGSQYVCPAQVDEPHTRQIKTYACHIYREFDLAPYARMDCILDREGLPWFLEANTLPGFTELSLVPMAARAAGIEIGELTELLMLCALEAWERRNSRAEVPA
jgi:D-alanine-D-alanine ligase